MSTSIDFGKVVAQDQRSGDVYVDRDGELNTLEGTPLVVQECMVALKTILGEEVFDMEWGFDIFGIISNPFGVDPMILIMSAVMACLSTSKIPMLREVSVTNIRASTKEGEENNYDVDIGISTLSGEDVTLTTNVGDS